jgi:ParB family transcriptional regulator, chromosome partitioning protein
VPEAAVRQLIEIPIDKLAPTPDQPRRRFDDQPLVDLAASIAVHGVLQPLIVTKIAGIGAATRYRIVAGERRWRAATLAGLRSVPALLIGVDEQQGREVAIIENIHRSDLQPLELAQAIDVILRSTGITQDEVARRLGKSRVSITNTLRLLGLEYASQQALAAGRISEGHARALLALTGAAQEDALRVVLAKVLSVRQTEALARRLAGRRARRPGATLDEPAFLADALREVLGAPVDVHGTMDAGHISINYHSREELERLCERIGGAELAEKLL